MHYGCTMNVPVLFYHHVNNNSGDTVTVTPEVFSSQMTYLHEQGYETLSVTQLIHFIAGDYVPAAKSVLITFDDGWIDNYLYAVPVLKKFNLKSTHFLITGRVENLTELYSIGLTPDHASCKKLINAGRAGEVVLGWDLVKELDKDPLFEFYSHTVNHFRCAYLQVDELFFELSHSKQSIEARLSKPCDYLCWPYGSYSQSALECAAQLGYKGTFSTINGFCSIGSDPFLLNRIEVQDSVEWFIDRLRAES